MRKALLVCFSVLLGTTLAMGGKGSSFPPEGTRILWEVPRAEQTTNYSCGAAAMQSVLGFYGMAFTEEQLIKELGSTPSAGTDHRKMAEFARKQGIFAEVRSDQTLSDLGIALDRGQPVIVEAQAYQDQTKPMKPYPDVWDAGHYMVAVGLDSHHIYFVDPSMDGKRGYIPVGEFLQRWHDLDFFGKKLYRTAIYFSGSAKPIPPWGKIP